MNDTFVTKDLECPCCSYVMDRVTAISGPSNGPRPGDITVCLGCSALLEFKGDLSYGPLRDKKIQEIKQDDPELWETLEKLVKLVQEVRGVKV